MVHIQINADRVVNSYSGRTWLRLYSFCD